MISTRYGVTLLLHGPGIAFPSGNTRYLAAHSETVRRSTAPPRSRANIPLPFVHPFFVAADKLLTSPGKPVFFSAPEPAQIYHTAPVQRQKATLAAKLPFFVFELKSCFLSLFKSPFSRVSSSAETYRDGDLASPVHNVFCEHPMLTKSTLMHKLSTLMNIAFDICSFRRRTTSLNLLHFSEIASPKRNFY